MSSGDSCDALVVFGVPHHNCNICASEVADKNLRSKICYRLHLGTTLRLTTLAEMAIYRVDSYFHAVLNGSWRFSSNINLLT